MQLLVAYDMFLLLTATIVYIVPYRLGSQNSQLRKNQIIIESNPSCDRPSVGRL